MGGRRTSRCWRATFYMTGMEHSITSATASAWGANAVASGAARRRGEALRRVREI